MAVSLVRHERSPHAAALRARSESARRSHGAKAEAGQPSRAAPRVREPSVAERRRSALRANAARPRRYFHYADLYACAGGAAEKPRARFAPIRGVLKPWLICQRLP